MLSIRHTEDSVSSVTLLHVSPTYTDDSTPSSLKNNVLKLRYLYCTEGCSRLWLHGGGPSIKYVTLQR